VKKSLLASALSLLVIAIWSMACASPPPPAPPPTYGINSTPSGATVKVDGAIMGTTPMQFSRFGAATLTIEKTGFKTINTGIGPSSPRSLHFELEKLAPTTFTRTLEPTWAGIEIRPELGYENAWNAIVDLLARRFDLEVISKDNGYVRTNWLYTWTGVMSEDYRVRVTVKFAPDHSKLEVKSEAQFRDVSGWVLGTDEALLQTLKTDIMGSVGRSTR
jgi:hypothetical protein